MILTGIKGLAIVTGLVFAISISGMSIIIALFSLSKPPKQPSKKN